jgi:hypothetical protein
MICLDKKYSKSKRSVSRFIGINITMNFIGLGLFISMLTIIIFTLKQIFDTSVGVELYYFVRFYFSYLFGEVKGLKLKFSNSIKLNTE